MYDRTHVRQIISDISAENLSTTFRVERGELFLNGKTQPLTDKQIELAKRFKKEIIWYLKTPPDIKGPCLHCKEEVSWLINKFGVWVCSCYYVPRARNQHVNVESAVCSGLKGYWNRKEA